MPEPTTNLLPPERIRAQGRAYALRLAVVAVALATILALAAGVLLIPTYVLLSASASAKEAHLAALNSKLSSDDEKSILTRLSDLSKNASTLVALAKKPPLSPMLREALSIARPGITLVSFAYTPAGGKVTASTLQLSGTAATRDALRDYQLALQGASFARSATLPVSAYANDADIPFMITITLASSGAAPTP